MIKLTSYLKREVERIYGLPCPDGIDGCLVLHQEDKIDIDKCDCKHTISFVLTLGDGCSHVVPHPTKKQIKKFIKPWLKQLLKDL